MMPRRVTQQAGGGKREASGLTFPITSIRNNRTQRTNAKLPFELEEPSGNRILETSLVRRLESKIIVVVTEALIVP